MHCIVHQEHRGPFIRMGKEESCIEIICSDHKRCKCNHKSYQLFKKKEVETIWQQMGFDQMEQLTLFESSKCGKNDHIQYPFFILPLFIDLRIWLAITFF